ncbi:hypothetical protein WG66_002941 [Moniliophthora roreri]|nr:hypothetical protein WG66_002941 [Moniliophthora roreri]
MHTAVITIHRPRRQQERVDFTSSSLAVSLVMPPTTMRRRIRRVDLLSVSEATRLDDHLVSGLRFCVVVSVPQQVPSVVPQQNPIVLECISRCCYRK